MFRSPRSSRFVIVGLVVGSGSLVACTAFSDTYISSRENQAVDDQTAGASGSSAATSSTPGSGASTCAGATLTKVDVSKLTACGGGKGHCFAKGQVPMGKDLAACPDASQVCVPDEILAAGGGKLTGCKSVIGAGACVTGSLFPELMQRGGSALSKDVCKDGQLCVPCTDPTNNNASTGMCDAIGVYDKDCGGAGSATIDAGAPASSLPKCCTHGAVSNGVCIAASAIPEDQRDDAPDDTCSAGNKCVPAAFVAGKPVTCNSGTFGKGVCMDACFDDMLGFAGDIGILSRQGCGSTELCVPCSFVSDQGVPGCQ